jgi:predicted DNA-binding transcriptional regulator YafY
LSFSSDEAIMLLLGADFMAQNFDAQYRGAAQTAAHKIMAVLPDKLRTEVEYLESSIRFIALTGSFAPETLQVLRRAIMQRRRVYFSYEARKFDGQSSENSRREADPYGLIHVAGPWMLVAYCHKRQDIRHFRLDRMEDVALLDKVFTRPADFKFMHQERDDRPIMVRVLFDVETARWVRETPSFFQVAEEECTDGLLVTLKVRHPNEVLSWVLSWGSHVRVLEPETLRETLAVEAQRMLENHAVKEVSR